MIDFNDPFKEWDAAYVLGALSPAEKSEYENHLAACQSCAAAVKALAGIPKILGKIDPQTATILAEGTPNPVSISPWDSPEFIQNLTKRAKEEQTKIRFRQRIGLAAAAIIVITVSVTSGVAIHSSNSSGSSNLTGRPIKVTNVQPKIMTASFRVTSKAWGTRFDWNCSYASDFASIYGAKSYDLVVTDMSGIRSVIASWSASGTKATGLAATSALAESQIKSVEITLSGSTDPLVIGKTI
jgi:hypothetical protein